MTASPTAVAMSGGVDSSVTAALLARESRPLVGFSMQLVDRLAGEEERYGRCCSPDDFRDARKVADRLGFPHYVVDMEDEFLRQVVEPFAADYARGRTPSPCVRCNTFIKFDALLARARAVGADRVATGHYGILERDPRTGRTLLRRAVDRDKDQSYFLFDLSEEQRRGAEFPLGRLRKEEVRDLARDLGLATADKPESQDLCFVAETEDYPGAHNGLQVENSGKVARVLAAVDSRDSCSSAAGHYRFVETKNLNAFLMWIERAPGRRSGDRCAELTHALDCLARQAGKESST